MPGRPVTVTCMPALKPVPAKLQVAQTNVLVGSAGRVALCTLMFIDADATIGLGFTTKAVVWASADTVCEAAAAVGICDASPRVRSLAVTPVTVQRPGMPLRSTVWPLAKPSVTQLPALRCRTPPSLVAVMVKDTILTGDPADSDGVLSVITLPVPQPGNGSEYGQVVAPKPVIVRVVAWPTTWMCCDVTPSASSVE